MDASCTLPQTLSFLRSHGHVLVFSGSRPADMREAATRVADLVACISLAFSRPNGMDGSKAFKLHVAPSLTRSASPGELCLFLSMATDLFWAPEIPLHYAKFAEDLI